MLLLLNSRNDPIDLSGLHPVYFDTSSWNRLADHPRREQLIHQLKRSRCVVLASVISVGEVLQIKDLERRQLICSIMSALHGDGHILERPQELLAAAAGAFVRGDRDIILPRTDPGEWLDSYMRNPLSATPGDVQKIHAWLEDLDRGLKDFLTDIKPPTPDKETEYCSQSVLDREDFLGTLCKAPPAQRLALTVSQMREMCGRTDLWRAFAGTLACVIKLATVHAPAWKKGRKHPGGCDVWQLVHLGVTEVFVTEDTWMGETARRVSGCMRYPREVRTLEGLCSSLDG